MNRNHARALAGLAVSFVTGLLFMGIGALMNTPNAQGIEPGKVPMGIGIALTVLSLLAAGTWLLISIVRFSVAAERAHKAWLRSLPPAQRQAVQLAELAAAFAAADWAHHRMHSPAAQLHREALTYAQVHGGKVSDIEQAMRTGQPLGNSWIDAPRSGAHRMWG